MAEEIKKDIEPELTVKGLIEFLEYEEAMTTDKATANRIRTLLRILQVWN